MSRSYAYIHGFASGPKTTKGNELAKTFRRRGATLHIPDLNVPSFAEITYRGMLEGVDRLDREAGDEVRWCFIGSSMGGWVAARWAELHPERVDRLLLLAPGFDLPNRWRDLISPEDLDRWESRGWIEAEDGAGVTVHLRWDLMEDARRQPPWPEPECPTLVLHGRRDDVVPVEVSERFAATRPWVELEVLDDDHSLIDSLPRIATRAVEWFGLPDPGS